MSAPDQRRNLPRPQRGDVFLARLDPAEGSEQAGTRPVVVVTRDAINANSPVVVIIPLTDAANPKRDYPSHVWIAKGVAGLRIDSIAKAEQIRAIQISRFVSYTGRLPAFQMTQLEEAIRITLALR
jgi:mRNA interferase MazF